jgi:hypothetical protein
MPPDLGTPVSVTAVCGPSSKPLTFLGILVRIEGQLWSVLVGSLGQRSLCPRHLRAINHIWMRRGL